MQNDARRWLQQAYPELFDRMSHDEQRIVAKAANSVAPGPYFFGVLDTLDLFGVATTSYFDKFATKFVEEVFVD